MVGLKISIMLSTPNVNSFKGGHAKLSTPFARQLAETHGPEAAAQMIRHQLDQVAALEEVVEKESIDCELLVTRSFDIFFDDRHAQQMYEFLSREQEKEMLWTKEVQWLEKGESDKVSLF